MKNSFFFIFLAFIFLTQISCAPKKNSSSKTNQLSQKEDPVVAKKEDSQIVEKDEEVKISTSQEKPKLWKIPFPSMDFLFSDGKKNPQESLPQLKPPQSKHLAGLPLESSQSTQSFLEENRKPVEDTRKDLAGVEVFKFQVVEAVTPKKTEVVEENSLEEDEVAFLESELEALEEDLTPLSEKSPVQVAKTPEEKEPEPSPEKTEVETQVSIKESDDSKKTEVAEVIPVPKGKSEVLEKESSSPEVEIQVSIKENDDSKKTEVAEATPIPKLKPEGIEIPVALEDVYKPCPFLTRESEKVEELTALFQEEEDPNEFEEAFEFLEVKYKFPTVDILRIPDSAFNVWIKNPEDMAKDLERSYPYRQKVEELLRSQGMDPRFSAMAMTESEYYPHAVNEDSGATGPWQILYGTAKGLGLRINDHVDERKSFKSSTLAAIKYLKKHHFDFGEDWLLSMAAYHCGNGCVRSAVRRTGGNCNYWALAKARRLPRTTRFYISKIAAVDLVIHNPEAYGVPSVDYSEIEPLNNQDWKLEEASSFTQLAKRFNTEARLLRKLNPEYKSNFIPYRKSDPPSIQIPIEAIQNQVTAFESEVETEAGT